MVTSLFHRLVFGIETPVLTPISLSVGVVFTFVIAKNNKMIKLKTIHINYYYNH